MEMGDYERSIRAISTDPEVGPLVAAGFDRAFSAYANATWFRALIQWFPGGGSADTLLAGRGTHLNQQRVEEFLRNVDQRVSRIEESVLNKDLLESDEVFELFRSCVQVVARATSEYKRGVVADFFVGAIERGVVDDLSQQIAADIEALQELHLRVLAALPVQPHSAAEGGVGRLEGMPQGIYMKVMDDLQRMGFVYYVEGYGGGPGRVEQNWHTTDYVGLFKAAVLYRSAY